ncbi:MAG TPA: ATP-binding protein, partial [Pyrinomonadaceae bacterium]
MSLRTKLLLLFFACGVVPALLLCLFNYRSGAGAVTAQLRAGIRQDLSGLARDVEATLRDSEAAIADLARSRPVTTYVKSSLPAQAETASEKGAGIGTSKPPQGPAAPGSVTNETLPEDVREAVGSFLRGGRKHLAAVACVTREGKPLFLAERGPDASEGGAVSFRTTKLLLDGPPADARAWAGTETAPLRSAVTRGRFGPFVRYTVPVSVNSPDKSAVAALLVDLRLDVLFREAAAARAPVQTREATANFPRRVITVLDRGGQIIYHTNEALNHQKVEAVMPYFLDTARRMSAGASGDGFYDSPEGDRWLTSYAPVEPAGLSAAVADDETAATGGLRRAALLGIILTALAGLIGAAFLTRVASRITGSVERLADGARNISRGRLGQRVEVHSGAELSRLAEAFNEMSARLGEQVAREAETKQFESFVRISAMLTHDLKNAIAGLSLLVSNMERKFDDERFRSDAMLSLRESADKLRRLVAKLSNPVETLSGEYKLPRPVDLVPVVKKVLAATAEPASRLHEVETRLPPSLVVTADAERMEKVLENLVINALEAMGANKGRLTVEAGAAGVGEVFFSVCDTGPGISEEFRRARLFRPFSTTKRSGIGLGLYTCREVVRAH